MPEHTADLRNVVEDDWVTIDTTFGWRFEQVECISRESWPSDEKNSVGTEILTWEFEAPSYSEKILRTSIIDGTSSLDSVDYPVHKTAALVERTVDCIERQPVGYFDSVEIHGQRIE